MNITFIPGLTFDKQIAARMNGTEDEYRMARWVSENGVTEADVDEAYERGVDAGRSEGYDEAYGDGYDEGFDNSLAKGQWNAEENCD